MRYTGIQPQYFPRLHYFARILNTDVFMVRDEAQFVLKHKYPDGSVDKSYQAHTPIKHSFGRHLLTVPTKHDGFIPIYQTEIFYSEDWAKNHLAALKYAYGKSPNYTKIYKEIESLLNIKYKSLADLSITTIIWGILNLLNEKNINKKKLSLEYLNKKLKAQKIFRLKEVRLSSKSPALKSAKNLSANEKIVALCKEIGATEDYCGGTGVTAYVDHEIFLKNGIKITVQDWKCTTYPQRFKEPKFIPNLTIIDLLMNVATKEATKILNG